MPTYVFQCPKCKNTATKDSNPSAAGCPGGGHHQWTRLGEIGNTTYICKKCNTKVETKSNPSAAGCPSGGHHQWSKL